MDLDTFDGGTTTVISSSPSSLPGLTFWPGLEDSSVISTSSVPLTPFSAGPPPFIFSLSPLISFPRLVTPFFEIDLDRDDAARVWERRSFLLLEPEELDLGLSPSVGEDASGLFERRLRLSVGMFWGG
jgi:hypothetical protein